MAYYYEEEKGWKRYGEGVIPVIILLLIAIVLIGKTTPTFCSVPVMNQFLCTRTGEVKIGVIGTLSGGDTKIGAEKLQEILDTQGTAYSIYYTPVPLSVLQYPREKMLKDFDLVIVSGVQNLTYAQRDAIGEYLKAGGNVILIGDAATTDPNDPLVRGWSPASFGDQVPVELEPEASQSGDITKNLTEANLIFWGTHPVLHDYAERYKLNLSEVACDNIKVVKVKNKEGNIIALLQGTGEDNKEDNALAIVEGSGMFGGKILYFNYDPGCTRGIAFASIRYLAGR